ncbi:MAG: GHKL domain-containing protein [Clostridiales bacterium]|nr:GHKL domain-containing protein [Clostridiales bacterium]
MVINIVLNILLSIFDIYILYKFFNAFFDQKGNVIKEIILWNIYFVWQIIYVLTIQTNPYLNVIIVNTLSLLILIISYHGHILKKCVFSITINSMALLLETILGYLFMYIDKDYMKHLLAGSIISKLLLLVIVLTLGKIFQDTAVAKLSHKYSFLLLAIPVSSIYVVSNIFFLSSNYITPNVILRSLLSSFIMLGINIIVFCVYKKSASDAELHRLNTVFKQQIILYDKHMSEKETALLEFQNARHDMKQKLYFLIDLAQNEKCEEIIEYIHELINENGISLGYSRTGNTSVDTLINYKYSTAQKYNINFDIDLNIPTKWNFKTADLCVILGNALDNALEAVMKSSGKRDIKLRMHYTMGNLSIVIINTYNGILKKGKNGKLLTTKADASIHGLGLHSIKKAVEKYHGTVHIDYTEIQFCLKLLLYGKK